VIIRLPRPSVHYDAANEAATRREIETALARLPQTSASSGLAARRRVIKTTNSLAAQDIEQGQINMGAKTQVLLLLETNRACRLRLYSDTAARAEDADRSLSADPKAGIGVLAEFIWLTAHTKHVSPAVVLYNADETVSDLIYYTVQNLSGSTGAITLTFTVLSLEGAATGTGGGGGGGGGSVPTATDTVTGTVRTDVTEGDPLVYTKATADTLLTGKSDIGHTHPTLPSAGEKDALTGTFGAASSTNKYVTDTDPRLPTQDEADALAGTSGTPSNTNRYVTDSDPRLTGVGGGGSGGAKFPMVPPTSPTAYDDEWPGTALDAKWSWVNQGAATAVVKGGVLTLTAPASAGDNLRVVQESLPAGAWEFEAFVAFQGNIANFCGGGICLRNSANGRVEILSLGYNNQLILSVERFNSPTSWNSAIATQSGNWLSMIGGWSGCFLRIAYDGASTLTFKVSANGKTWRTAATSTVATFLSALTHVGFFANSNNSAEASLVSWYIRRVA